jgi:hypothetical protein
MPANLWSEVGTSTAPPPPYHIAHLLQAEKAIPFSFPKFAVAPHHSPLTTHSLLTNNNQQTNTNKHKQLLKIIACNGKNTLSIALSQ